MSKPSSFEKSISELGKIVAQLEKGELSLEDAIKQYEKGITLAKKCEQLLNQAEQKVETLSTMNETTGDSADD